MTYPTQQPAPESADADTVTGAHPTTSDAVDSRPRTSDGADDVSRWDTERAQPEVTSNAVVDEPYGHGEHVRTEATPDRHDGEATSVNDAVDQPYEDSHARDEGQQSPSTSEDDAVPAMLDADTVDGYLNRWQRLQMRFVDDPRDATVQAADLVDEASRSLIEAVDRQRESLASWRANDDEDTEKLRTSFKRYRALLDRLVSI